MPDVNVEDFLAENAIRSGVELSSNVTNAYEDLQISINPACMGYQARFQRLLEAVEQFGEDISEGMYAVVCDPTYNTLQVAKALKFSAYLAKSVGYEPFRGVSLRIDGSGRARPHILHGTVYHKV